MSIQGWIMNQMFRAMPGDPPGQPHDYAAERARNERRKLFGQPISPLAGSKGTPGKIVYFFGRYGSLPRKLSQP